MAIIVWIALGATVGIAVHRLARPYGSILLGFFLLLAAAVVWVNVAGGDSVMPPIGGVAVVFGVLSGFRAASGVGDVPTDRRGVFISHRSIDANLARQVAENLIAVGLWVWIDEYDVSLDEYDDWRSQVSRGIANSLAGIAIVGRDFAGSKACSDEMDQMLAAFGADGVFVVENEETKGDAVRTWPELEASTRIESDDPFFIVAAIREAAPFRLAPPRAPFPVRSGEPCLLDGKILGTAYRWDVAGWNVLGHGGESTYGQVAGPTLSLAGKPVVQCNLFAGAEMRRKPIEEVSRTNRRESESEDQAIYRATMDQAKRWLYLLDRQSPSGSPRPQEVGKHLFFHDGVGQLAVSYRMPGYWSRKYSLLLSPPERDVGAEFVFTFGVQGSFEDFCAVGWKMDRLVQSFEWGGRH